MDEEVLLPPPRKPVATPLSNADFRKFLDTPRRDQPASSFGQQHRDKDEGTAEGQRQKARKPHRPRRKPEAEAQAEDDQLYRDRAEERRKGLNPDYERVNLQDATGPDSKVISVEDSKFLGGDVEHTHLVKGLDFQLLQKVKEELVKPGSVKEPKAKTVEKKQEVKFSTPIGRAVYKAVFDTAAQDVSTSFLPRRLAFVYELDEDTGIDAPTVLRRSLADCPQPVDTITATVDAPVLERLAKILSHMRVAGGGKRLKRKDKLRMLEALDAQQQQQRQQQPADQGLVNGLPGPPMAAPAQAGPADEDDIFAGAGSDYKLEAKPKGNAKPQNGTYFGEQGELAALPPPPPPAGAAGDDMDMDLDEPPPPPGPPPPPPAPTAAGAGPSLPPEGYDREAAYAQMHRAANQGYEAYMQANVAYQASQDPEYQALLARQQGETGAGGAVAGAPARGEALTAEQREAGLASVFRREDAQLAARREADARERDPSYVSDAYAECYPSYHEYAPTIVDSDDEDLSHMDTKGKGQGRADFETEEQWQAYKSKKEAAPKAAFQFGVKVSDGRKGHKELGNKAREQKFNNQLNQIQKKLEADGGDYSSAFAAPSMDADAGPSGASKKRRI